MECVCTFIFAIYDQTHRHSINNFSDSRCYDVFDVMSRKNKQADLRRRMAEARSKLLQSQYPSLGDEEGNDSVSERVAVGVKKRPRSPCSENGGGGGGGGGILRKSKYTTSIKSDSDLAVKQSSDSRPNPSTSLGSLVNAYGDSSSDVEDESATAATVKIAPNPPQPQTTKEDRSEHNKQSSREADISKSSHMQKQSSLKEDVSEEAWEEFNAMLEADEAANNGVHTDTHTDSSDGKLNDATIDAENESSKEISINDTSVNEKSISDDLESKSSDDKKPKSDKEDVYDNDDINDMEQTSYEARLARLILLKSKKRKQQHHEAKNNDEVQNLPSADDFHNPSLAWAEERGDEQEVVTQDKSRSEPNTREEGSSSSAVYTTSSNLPTVSIAKILRGRRDKAKMLATRGEDTTDNAAEDIDASDGNWF